MFANSLVEMLDASSTAERMRILDSWTGSRLTSLLMNDVVSTPESLAAVVNRSYQHANGFSKLVLAESPAGGRLRLHVWKPGSNAEENIHDHRWSFVSRVLTGCLTSELWDTCSRHAPGAQRFRKFAYQPARNQNHYGFHEVGHDWICRASQQWARAGTIYSMEPGELHRIVAETSQWFTSTLVYTAPTQVNTNRMFTLRDMEGEHDKPGLQAEEIVELLNEVRRRCVELESWHQTAA